MPAPPHQALKKIAFQRLAKDLAGLMQDELARPEPKLERLEILWLLLLGGCRASGPALKQQKPFKHYTDPRLQALLFCDFAHGWNPWDEAQAYYDFGRWQIHTEAKTYVSELLWKRSLQLARKIGQEPTNTHKLLQSLCRFSAAPGEWAGTRVERDRQALRHSLDWFEPVKKALLAHRPAQASARVSTNASLRFGPYWLKAADCAETVGDQLSVKDVLEIVPKPLRPGFAADAGFLKLFQGVIEMLNRPYALLRSCGLPPAQWLQRLDDPDSRELSFDKLRALAKLRGAFMGLLKAAQNRHEALRLKGERSHWEDTAAEREKLFRQAFAEQAAGRKIAGFARFDAFAESAVGQEMLERAGVHAKSKPYFEGRADDLPPADTVVPLFPIGEDEEEGAAEEGWAFDEDLPEEDQLFLSFLFEQSEAGEIPLGDQHPVLHHFLLAYMEDRLSGLATDKAFRALLARHPGYADLAQAALFKRIVIEGKLAALDVLLGPKPPYSSCVIAYIRWVMVEEKPVHGPDGLLGQADFQALLAQQHPLLHQLPPPQLAERLHRLALNAWAELRSYEDG